MRLFPLVCAALSACTFVGAPADQVAPGADAGRDPVTVDADPRAPAIAQCDATDSQLRLCLDFEDPAPLANKAPTTHAIQSQNIDLELRGMAGADGQSAALDEVSQLTVGESPSLDVDLLSMSMWLQPHAADVEQFLLDNHLQYATVYEDDGEIRCQVGSASARSEIAVPVSQSNWTHVACTYDREQLRVYIDGSLAGCSSYDRAISKAGDQGSSIGGNIETSGLADRFSGGIDFVRVHNRVQTSAEICSAAGKTTCASTCPGSGGPGGGD